MIALPALPWVLGNIQLTSLYHFYLFYHSQLRVETCFLPIEHSSNITYTRTAFPPRNQVPENHRETHEEVRPLFNIHRTIHPTVHSLLTHLHPHHVASLTFSSTNLLFPATLTPNNQILTSLIISLVATSAPTALLNQLRISTATRESTP